jgi:iron transport multicopper oxidase
MSVMQPALVALALFGGVFAAIGPVTNLNITNVFLQPDGFNRSTVVAQGVFPGPLISASKNDHFQINVVDALTNNTMRESTSLHWHGLFQAGTVWADGPAFVSQCPIAPGNSFLYDFVAKNQTGTFWYHSHLSTQYCDGLRGPLVIYDPNDPYLSLYDVDNETTVITVADWYHLTAPNEPALATPDSTLINGLGRQTTTPNGTLSVINVAQGKRYRFRVVSISCDPNFLFSIDGHNFTVIEADGVTTLPVVVDSIQIFAGQRYSVILVANQTVNNYWIRAAPNNGVNTGFTGGTNSAILRYVGAANSDPVTMSTAKNLLLETSLVPLNSPGAPGAANINGADVSLNLAITINTTTLKFSINNASFTPPTVPVLLQILSGATAASNLLPNGSVYALPLNKTIQISIPGGSPGSPHPFHLHGHNFDVIRSAGNATYNYATPPRRDVVSTGATGDNVTIRFTTDNPGPWFLHCHIDWHLEAGLAIVLAEGAAGIASGNTIPQSWSNLCPLYNALNSTQQ